MTILGVNLGGWFIPEKWMSSSLFAGTDAQDLYQLLATPKGERRYLQHMDNWITEDDFRWMKAHGIVRVRLPIGYWALGGDDRYPDVSKYLDWSFAMAEKYQISILLDLHAARGSQNGRNHSGRIGPIDWWRYKDQTLRDLCQLAE